jgi:hypothetical protein
VDPFALVLLAGLGALLVALWLLGRHHPGLGQRGRRSADEISQTQERLEAQDLDQMLAAHNARRRARGAPEVTVAEVQLRVVEDLEDQRRRREQYLAELELDQLLAATNARRRARGLPERTRAELQREPGTGPAPRA